MCVGPDRNAKGPTQTKVRQFDGTISVNQQILRLHVSMQSPALMTEHNPLEDLEGIALQGVKKKTNKKRLFQRTSDSKVTYLDQHWVQFSLYRVHVLL